MRMFDHDLLREWMIAECSKKEPCLAKFEERFEDCYADAFGTGAFLAISKTQRRNDHYRERMHKEVAACIWHAN